LINLVLNIISNDFKGEPTSILPIVLGITIPIAVLVIIIAVVLYVRNKKSDRSNDHPSKENYIDDTYVMEDINEVTVNMGEREQVIVSRIQLKIKENSIDEE
jgi:flagellar basal body-associated protein FliL